MDLGLTGRRALITGATRGIGLAIAETLADEGVDIAICSRDAKAVEAQVERLGAKGAKAWGRAADVSDAAALADWVAAAADALGGLDIAISNPSAMVFRNAEDDWRSAFEIDLLGSIRLFNACRPHLEAAAAEVGDAAYLMISSLSALETTRVSPYGALKAALNHYAKGLAAEMAPKGVRANVIAPGNIFHEGGVWDGVKTSSPDAFAKSLAANPTGRMGTPHEVASAVAFLASPRSRFTIGAQLLIDGSLSHRV